MHFLMIISTICLSVSLRLIAPTVGSRWQESWQRSLFFFFFPPLLLSMTFVSIFCMGYQGQMFGMTTGWFPYLLAIIFCTGAIILLVRHSLQAWQSIQQINRFPLIDIAGEKARILEMEFPYIAQVGFWRSQLIVSRGLLNCLSHQQLQAVLAHEKAHRDCHDTFWFFWLGWLKSLTQYLPHTEAWSQELLRLRELRADWQAAQQQDPLLLAESLLIITKMVDEKPFTAPCQSVAMPLDGAMPIYRLTERIEFLLENTNPSINSRWWNWGWIVLIFLPLAMIPWHS